ncbi:hypothetical protein IP84_11945 [beta proteobacterium AAP99]|nr:hypothetical protein IP84_11945 [beta proteobacterium AAP99]
MNHGVFYELQAGELLRLPRLRQPLRIMQGRVWLTAANQPDDRVLDAGAEWPGADAHEVVIEALCPARVLILAQRSSRAQPRMRTLQSWMRFAHAWWRRVRGQQPATA